MSRIGKLPVSLPTGVSVQLCDGNVLNLSVSFLRRLILISRSSLRTIRSSSSVRQTSLVTAQCTVSTALWCTIW